MGKIILCDCSVLAHKSIFQFGNMIRLKREGKLKNSFIPNSDYTYMNMLLGFLKKVVVNPEDKVLCILDSRNSWRKFFYPEYKANRKVLRAKHSEIDWTQEYDRIENINKVLEENTNWYFIKVDEVYNFNDLLNIGITKPLSSSVLTPFPYGIEADDIIATVCANYEGDKVIISSDADLSMLTYFSNTKFFKVTKKSINACYDIINSPLKVLSDKIRNGDVSDNILVDKKNDTPEQADIRKLIIDLIHLPDWVQNPILAELESKLSEVKEVNYANLPFQNSLGKRERFDSIYLSDKEVTLEASIKAKERKEKKKAKKKMMEVK